MPANEYEYSRLRSMVYLVVGASTLLSTPLAVHVLLWIYPYIPYIGMANPTKTPGWI